MAGIELDPQARDLAASVVKGTLSPEAAAAQAGVSLDTVNQWVTAYVTEAKASFEARAKSLLSQTKAGLLPQNGPTRPKPDNSVKPPIPVPPGAPPPSSPGRIPLPPPTPLHVSTNAQMASVPASTPVVAQPPPLVRPQGAQVSEVGPRVPRPQASAPTAQPLPKPMAVGTSYDGAIEKDNLLDVARSLSTLQQSGILVIRSLVDSGTIHFESGEIISASYRGSSGQDALWRLFDTAKGMFSVEGYSPPPQRTIDAPSSALLSEAQRRRSIVRHLKKHLGSSQQVFGLVPLTQDQLSALGKLEPQLLTLLDGKRSLKQVVAESPVDEFTTLSQIQKLHDKGHLVPATLRPVEVPSAAESISLSNSPKTTSELPAELPFKKRRLVKWVGTGAVTAMGMLGGAVFVAEGSLSPEAAAEAFARVGETLLEEPSEDAESLTAVAAASGLPAQPTMNCEAPPQPAQTEPAHPKCEEGMVFVAPGHFTMGTDNQSPALAAATPAHDVELQHGFCIDRVEVSVEAYGQCVNDKKCTEASAQASWAQTSKNEKLWAASLILHGKQCNSGSAERWNHPINCVTWKQANEYCAALGLRLPTEAEWEFTSRGASNRAYPWGDGAPSAKVLNACGKECRDWHESVGLGTEVSSIMYEVNDGFSTTAPVGAFGLGATPEGVFDLAGNVAEWTANAPYEYSTASTDDAPTNGHSHMIRGGAYNSGALEFVDPAFRFAMPDDVLSPGIGFRCASTP